jgi:riboflavin-specific deaminase-like protein
MRALLPEPTADVDLERAYAPGASPEQDRPFVRVNMISSVDGAITVGGRSGVLGGPGDRRLFHVLRSLADVILVGAGTVRAEGYGPAHIDDDAASGRAARGQAPVPPIAVVTRSCHLDWSSPFFTDAEARPIVVTTDDADEHARRRAAAAADVIAAGTGDVDLARALAALGARGARSVLVEGGPQLNAQLAEAGLVDELCLTISPRLVGGDGPRLLAGRPPAEPIALRTMHLLEDDGFYFLRLQPVRDAEGAGGRSSSPPPT